MTNLAAEVVAYLRYEREPIEAWRMIQELRRGGAWTKATEAEWRLALAEAGNANLIEDVGGKLRLKPEPKVEKEKQGELF